MAKKVSAELLRKIRNDISIETLIRNELKIPCKKLDGFFRFLCPICNGFHTSTLTKVNLGRCFNCKRNFNPIDIVMVGSSLNFMESINYLKPLLAEKSE